jgi:hypothetical protein
MDAKLIRCEAVGMERHIILRLRTYLDYSLCHNIYSMYVTEGANQEELGLMLSNAPKAG